MKRPTGTTKRQWAAAHIIQSLKKRNGLTRWEIEARFDKECAPFHYGIRLIRDRFGDNSLVTARPGGKGRIVYLLDPTLDQGLAYSAEQTKRCLTEAQHINHHLDWLAANYGNANPVRNARRYVRNLVEELEEVRVLLKS